MHDPVCGLPNRIFFGERLETVINDVRAGGATAAVFYIDLDHFKDVNDTLGHHIGDELILNVTQRLSHIMRGEDLVARLGGDEFAIITHCASDSYSLQAIAGRIIAAVCAPYMISGHNIIIGASIGIAVIDRRARDAADILRYADMALYRAKNEGRNRACIYDAAMDADLSNRKLLEGDLLYAIKNDGLAAAYQPIMNSSGEKVIGVEALARWNHPTIGQIPPSQFIPIAEHSGLIIDLGEWMLRRACLDGRAWPNLTIAVNVSPLQFRRSDFVEVVERILAETDFDANRLELELTESTLLGNLDTAELSMLRLKAIGVRFALDDFGTGYSSLLYLRRFPFDKLKIDSSFVRSIEKAPDAAAIVHAVVSLGRGLGMKVTAEGVETAEQHLFLRAAGVHSMQGYRFGKPGTASEINAGSPIPTTTASAAPTRKSRWRADGSFFYHEDVVAIVDGNDRITYTLFRAPADAASVDLGAQIAPTLDLLRGRLDAVPEHAVAVIAKQDPAKPGRHTALIQRFMDRPAIVGAVAVGTETDLVAGNARAPIVVAVRYIDAAMLNEISGHLQLTNLRKIDEPAPPPDQHGLEFADAQGNADRPLRLAADAAGRHHRRQRVAVHRAWRSAASRCWSVSYCATCGAPPRRSGPANCNCAISPCTIRCAACPTASISASGSRP